MRTTTHLLTAAAAAALVAGTAAAAPAATRAGGGIFWAAPTCEIAIENTSDRAIDVQAQTDQDLHTGILLRTYQPPLAQYDGRYEKSMLLGRLAAMPEQLPNGVLRIPAGRTGSIATGCTEEQMDGLGPWVTARDAQTGDLVHEWNNTYWLGHVHDDTGNVLLRHRG